MNRSIKPVKALNFRLRLQLVCLALRQNQNLIPLSPFFMLKKFLVFVMFLQFGALQLNAMRIFINVEGGEELTLNLEPSDEISTMRELVAQSLNVPVSQIKLIFGTTILEDFRMLMDYNIQKDSRVTAQNTVLPIVLLSFDLVKTAVGINLKWTTSSEKNNQYFLLSRSSDGKTFQQIAKKFPNNANSNAKQVYAAEDKTPFHGQNYYKLEQVDLNGDVNLVDVKPISFAYPTSVTAYPNPSSSHANISFEANKFNRIVVYNLMGKAMINEVLKFGTTAFRLDLSSYQSGQYFVELAGANERSVTTLVKK